MASCHRDVRCGYRTYWSLPIDTAKESVVAVGGNIEDIKKTDEQVTRSVGNLVNQKKAKTYEPIKWASFCILHFRVEREKHTKQRARDLWPVLVSLPCKLATQCVVFCKWCQCVF